MGFNQVQLLKVAQPVCNRILENESLRVVLRNGLDLLKWQISLPVGNTSTTAVEIALEWRRYTAR